MTFLRFSLLTYLLQPRQARLKIEEAAQVIHDAKVKVYLRNDPYSQCCSDQMGTCWYANNMQEMFSAPPTGLITLKNYHCDGTARGGDYWVDPDVRSDTDNHWFMHNHYAALTQICKYASHNVLYAKDTKNVKLELPNFVVNTAMNRINATLEEAVTAFREDHTTGRTLVPNALKILNAKLAAFTSPGRVKVMDRHFLAHLIDCLGMFATIDSTRTTASTGNKDWVKKPEFKRALQNNCKYFWHLIFNNVRAGFYGEVFLASGIFPNMSQLVCFSNNDNPYKVFQKKRDSFNRKAKNGIKLSWMVHMRCGPYKTLPGEVELMWGHHFALLSLVDPELYVRNGDKSMRRYLVNMSHLPNRYEAFREDVGYFGLVREFKTLFNTDSIPDEDDTRGRRTMQNNFFHWNKDERWNQYFRFNVILGADADKKPNDSWKFFGGAWQDFFDYKSMTSIGTGGTAIRWKKRTDKLPPMGIDTLSKFRRANYLSEEPAAAKNKRKVQEIAYEWEDSDMGSSSEEENEQPTGGFKTTGLESANRLESALESASSKRLKGASSNSESDSESDSDSDSKVPTTPPPKVGMPV